MEPIVGSVLQVMPALPGWSVLFALESDEKTVWEEPVIAWAVVVIWTTPDAAEGEPEPKRREYQTEVQPYTIGQDGVTDVPCMREGVVQLAVLQAGQIRIAREPV